MRKEKDTHVIGHLTTMRKRKDSSQALRAPRPGLFLIHYTGLSCSVLCSSTIRNEETSKSLLKPSNKDACDWMVESLYSLGCRHEMVLYFLKTNVQSCSPHPPLLLGHQFS